MGESGSPTTAPRKFCSGEPARLPAPLRSPAAQLPLTSTHTPFDDDRKDSDRDGFVPFLLFRHYLNISSSIQLHYHILQILPKLIKLEKVTYATLHVGVGRVHTSRSPQFSDPMPADGMIPTQHFQRSCPSVKAKPTGHVRSATKLSFKPKTRNSLSLLGIGGDGELLRFLYCVTMLQVCEDLLQRVPRGTRTGFAVGGSGWTARSTRARGVPGYVNGLSQGHLLKNADTLRYVGYPDFHQPSPREEPGPSGRPRGDWGGPGGGRGVSGRTSVSRPRSLLFS